MRICASLSNASELDAAGDADMVEIRLDLIPEVPDTRGKETLVTFRGPVDLGVLPDGFSGTIDIGTERRPDTDLCVLASYHDYDGTPGADEIASMLNGMDADIRKGAFRVNTPRDLMSIFESSGRIRGRHVVLGMGGLGTVTRIRQRLLGNEFSFGYVGEPTAPGQLSVERMSSLGDDCMILGVIGDPLGKSRSPAMQNAALEHEGIDGIYLPFETPDLDRIEDVIRSYGIRGANVTIPYKKDIMDHLDRVDGDAASIGAVNTIVNDGGILTGYNTDVDGIGKALEVAGIDPEDRRVLIMGSGGAARACAHFMNGRNADIVITGRNRDTGASLAKDFGAMFKTPSSVSVKMYDLVVNCTPVGMYSDGPYPINIDAMDHEQAVFDMAYPDTPLLRTAESKGCRIARGSDMLAGQGAASFRMWTGRDGTFDVMRRMIA